MLQGRLLDSIPRKGSGRDNRHLMLPTVCWAPGNRNKGSTDAAFTRFMVPLEKQEESGGYRSSEERLLTPHESEEASWRRAGCLP